MDEGSMSFYCEEKVFILIEKQLKSNKKKVKITM